jgi:hypothetical protein
MSMMSQIHESMTVTGDLARVERMSDEVAELDAKIAAEPSLEWRVTHKRRRRLLRLEIDRTMGAHALKVARS